MASLNRITYSDNLVRLQEFKHWLMKNNLYSSDTRLERIIERMLKINNYFNSNQIETLIKEEGNVNLWYTLTESSSFIEIYEMIRDLDIQHLPRRTIKTALGGPFLPMDELPGSENVNYRNILFELELASKLYRKKINVTGFDDIQFLLENTLFYVQCKRLFSKRNIHHNIKSAQKQLITNFKDTKSKGVIALSIDKILELDGMILRVENENYIQEKIYTLVNNFIKNNNNLWIEVVHPQIIGIILVTKFVTHILDINLLSSCFFTVIVPLYPSSDPNTLLLQHLASRITP